jgi:hypothetical protein
MSKGNSHQFSGTKGEKIAQGIVPENQHKMVTSWAQDLASELEGQSKRKRDGFKTACVAFDEETGELYYGRNGGINRDASNVTKNPVLFGDSKHEGILPSKSLNAYPTSWNCAETDAINKALNSGAKLENIHIYTISTTKRGFGSDKESCINCKTAYKGRIKKNNTGWTK